MIRISKNQVTAFQDASIGKFALQMSHHLRNVLPKTVVPRDDETLVASLHTRMAQAFSYGITDKLDVQRYLECSYMLGWSDDAPDNEARTVLTQDELSAEAKIDLIELRIESL